jgi:hypothetical protein
VDAGSKEPAMPTASPSGLAPRTSPSILPSVRPHPTGGLIPPYVAEKGVAGIGTFYAYHRGQAAAAARLRAFLGPNWRGMVVEVCNSSKTFRACLDVRLTDYESSLLPGRLIDLDRNDWVTLCGDPARGVCLVTVTHG